MIERRDVVYVVDEKLPAAIARMLANFGFQAEVVQLNPTDHDILERIRRRYPVHSVMITGDHAMRRDHRQPLIDSGASVAWLQANNEPGLTQIHMATAFVITMHETLESAMDPLCFDLILESSPAQVTVAIAPRNL